MTNQQGAPDALRLADRLSSNTGHVGGPTMDAAAAELRRLHAENERLAALVEAQQPATHVQNPAGIEHVAGDVLKNGPTSNMAQQPAPSAAAAGEVPLPLLVRDIAADLGTTPIQVCTALAQLGFGGHSVNMAVTPRMAQSLRAHFASTTPQADSQPAPVVGRMSPSKEWLETRLAIADDSGVQAGVPPKNARPCDAPPGCNSHNCLECNDYHRAARAPADSVLEDAARLDWLELAGPTSICRVIDRPHDGEVEVSTDDLTGYGSTLREAIDAARKQGGA